MQQSRAAAGTLPLLPTSPLAPLLLAAPTKLRPILLLPCLKRTEKIVKKTHQHAPVAEPVSRSVRGANKPVASENRKVRRRTDGQPRHARPRPSAQVLSRQQRACRQRRPAHALCRPRTAAVGRVPAAHRKFAATAHAVPPPPRTHAPHTRPLPSTQLRSTRTRTESAQRRQSSSGQAAKQRRCTGCLSRRQQTSHRACR